MRRFFRTAAVTAALFFLLPATARAAELLVPVGAVIGLQLQDDTVTVAAYDDTSAMAAREAGIQVGDEIVSIDDTAIDCTDDVRSALQQCSGEITMTIRREGKQRILTMTPEVTETGPRLGLYLRQGIAGIGTVTFYDPETGRFGTLGHGVSDSHGKLLQMREGSIFEASVGSVIRGKAGRPGQLKGSTNSLQPFGKILCNTPQGVFGTVNPGWAGNAIPVASYDEIKTGDAVIRSTISGNETREYSVEILKIYPASRSDGRNFLIRVTDPELLAATGGIVQGMSGSPICQNGKIVGAVTHVLVNDPTTGYGIFIENMLDAAA